MDHNSYANASLIPSAMDLLLVFPRLAQRAGSFALYHMPEAVDNIAGKIFNGGSIIADATSQQTVNSTITNTSRNFVQSTGAVTLDAALREAFSQGGDDPGSSFFGMIVQGLGRLKSIGGMFSYLTSRWALATFTAAIVLNRTQFYASSREHLRLQWYMRFTLYTVPMMVFLVQLVRVLQAMKCQTSLDFALLRYDDPLRHLAIDFGGEGGFLYKLSSTLLPWQDDISCCAARNMSLLAVENDRSQLRGSMSLLFTFFLTLCTSQLFETLACALQGRQPMPETGMTIFEHSLAFAECEAMISSALGFGLFGLSKLDGSETSASDSNIAMISRSEMLQRLNVPPEVLLVCLISCFSHLSSATLAVLGIRHKVRLVNTAIWATCYMSAFIWSFMKIFTSAENVTTVGVLRFPTVCIVGFIPHLLILIGILVCALIYAFALLITALSIPEHAIPDRLSFRQRFAWAYHNLQANVQFSSSSNIRIKMSEDFYTTLLKVGFSLLTAASEAVYLNEGSRIQVAKMTWVEQKRVNELAAALDQRRSPAVPAELLGEGIARGVEFTDHHNTAISLSPYARERRSKSSNNKHDSTNPGDLDSGLGIVQRRSRMHLTFDFMVGMFWLIVGLEAQLTLNTLRTVGIEYRPAWLLKAAGVPEKQRDVPLTGDDPRGLEFSNYASDGKLLSRALDYDIEAETRRMWESSGPFNALREVDLDNTLYAWWRKGPLFGEADSSVDYQPPILGDDDDTTSMISMSTNAGMNNEEWETEDDGRRTPTQRDPFGRFDEDDISQSDAGLDVERLSRLLNPRSIAERDEARILSYSLQSNRPTTRSQYQRSANRDRTQLLTGLRGQTRQLTEEEEELDLENFILERRSQAKAKTVGTWESGAEGMGVGGPQCVVCQSTPRTILVWPCGCLSACEDCRVGLAARNYSKCICCRTDIAAYSRLYVP